MNRQGFIDHDLDMLQDPMAQRGSEPMNANSEGITTWRGIRQILPGKNAPPV